MIGRKSKRMSELERRRTHKNNVINGRLRKSMLVILNHMVFHISASLVLLRSCFDRSWGLVVLKAYVKNVFLTFLIATSFFFFLYVFYKMTWAIERVTSKFKTLFSWTCVGFLYFIYFRLFSYYNIKILYLNVVILKIMPRRRTHTRRWVST